MEFNTLRIFEAVAREGGVTAASRSLNCVQSNVTARIRNLEEELGVVLFRRRPRGMVLTPAGRELLDRARKILGLVEESVRAVKDDGRPRGPLTLGAYESSTVIWLPALLARFHALHPLVELSLQSGEAEAMIEGVLDYTYDGAFITPRLNHPELTQVPAFTEELVLITPPEVRSPGEIVNPTRLVFPRPCAYRDRLGDWFRQAGLRPVRTLELGSLNGIIGCVAAGMGLSLIPRLAAERAARAGELALHAIPPDLAYLPVYLTFRRADRPLSALRAFMEVLGEKSGTETRAA